MKSIITSSVVAIGMALCFSTPALLAEEKEKEQKLSKADVPAAVQKAADAEAKGGKIVRWEKEGENYEAVIERKGKQTGIALTPDGKILSRHDESKEHKETGEKY